MIFIRLLVAAACGIASFMATAIITDLAVVEILNASQDRTARTIQQMMITLSIPAGLALGWFFASKSVVKFFGKLHTRQARFKVVLAILFVCYYTVIIWELHDSSYWKEALFDIDDGALIVWWPVALLVIYNVVRWVMSGNKEKNGSQ